MTGFSEKLMSRKFWLALIASVSLFLVKSYSDVATIVVAYLAVQAGVDAFSSYTASKSETVTVARGD